MLAVAPSTLGSAHCLTAKRRTPFSPRAHYKLGTWFWGRRYSRWPRPHEFGVHDFYTWPTRCYAFEPCHLVSHSGRLAREFACVYGLSGALAGLFPPPALGECRHRSLARLTRKSWGYQYRLEGRLTESFRTCSTAWALLSTGIGPRRWRRPQLGQSPSQLPSLSQLTVQVCPSPQLFEH